MKKSKIVFSKNLAVVDNDNFNDKLLELTNSRAKSVSSKKVLHTLVQNFLNLSSKLGSTVHFSVTMTFPGDVSFKESWDLLAVRLAHIKEALSKLPVYSCLVGVEIHKKGKSKGKSKVFVKKTLYSLKSSDLLGRPHIHICLSLFNDFLCPDEAELYEVLKWGDNDDLEIRLLSSRKGFDVKNWFFYCCKELSDKATQQLVKSKVSLKSSCFFWFPGHKYESRCEALSSAFRDRKLNLVGELIPNLFVSWLPLVPFSTDEGTKVSIFLKKLLELNNRAIWPDRAQVCKLIPGAQASWTPEVSLSMFYTRLMKSLPLKGQELLNNSRSFNLYIRNYSKLDFDWLPKITVETYLVELSDGIYDFRLGELLPADNLGLTSCASYWSYHSFNNLPWPKVCLDIADRVVTSSFPYANRSENFVLKFADLFHCKKQNDKVIYLHGLPGVGKSALIEQILKLVVGCNFAILSNKKTPFQYDNVVDSNILFFNEFESAKASLNSTLSLAEGAPLVINRKFLPSTTINMGEDEKKHLVIISNEDPPNKGALVRRIDPFYLKEGSRLLRTRSEEVAHDKAIMDEAVSFCIFCNIIRARSQSLNPSIPSGWSGFNWPGSVHGNFKGNNSSIMLV